MKNAAIVRYWMTEELAMATIPIRLLLVDDHQIVRQGLRALLETEADFQIVGEASSGAEAVELAGGLKPDVILMDLVMPEMDGGDVFHHMKEEIELRDIPVVVVTAKAAPIDKVLWINVAKVDDYVTKPFGPRELVESVEKVLAKYEAQSA